MIDVVVDIHVSLSSDGLSQVFCISGHLDSLPLQTASAAIQQANARAPLDAYLVLSAPLLERIGVDPAVAHILLTDDIHDVYLHVGTTDPAGGSVLDLHAGKGETSKMLAAYPNLVRRGIMADLPPTDLTFADLVEWRKGGQAFQRLTPNGYFGSPAAADEVHGRQLMDQEIRAITSAIERRVRANPDGSAT
jgi:creatinine amidohydrolase